MALPVPFAHAYVLLLLALPGVWLLARTIAHRLTRDRGLRAVLPVGLTIGLWLASVQLASRATGSLHAGLPLGVLVAGAAGVAAEVARRRRPDPDPPTGERPSWWMAASALGTAALLVPAAFRFYFHDELFVGGHLSVAAQLQSGAFPPQNLQFPEYPLRYHYGFDLLVATLTAVLHLRVDQAIDTATLLLWVASWCLLWALGERLLGRRHAWLTPAMTLFAGGLPYACPSRIPSHVPSLLSECLVGRWSVNGPVTSYFFQHPWALGITMAAAAILVFTEREPASPRLRLGLLALLVGLVSFSEIALFAALLPSLTVAELWYEARPEWRRAPGALLAAVGAVAVGVLLGGFFVRAPGLVPPSFVLHAGFADSLEQTVRWNVMTFGAMWATGLTGLLFLRRGRLLFGLLAGGGLLVVNGLRYAGGSADIMKFATVVSLAFGVLGSAAISHLLSAEGMPRAARRVAAALFFVPAVGVSAFYLIAFALDLPTIPTSYRSQPDRLEGDDVDAALFVRGHARPGEMVYRAPGRAYAQWAGLPLPWMHWTTRKVWGFPPEKIAAREKLLHEKPADAARWREQGYRFFVLDTTTRDDWPLVPHARGWVTRGEARLSLTSGALEVIELVDPEP